MKVARGGWGWGVAGWCGRRVGKGRAAKGRYHGTSVKGRKERRLEGLGEGKGKRLGRWRGGNN